MKFLLRGPSAWSVYLTHLCVVPLRGPSVYIVWNFGRLIFNSYHVVTIILVFRLRSCFLLGVAGSRAVLMDLAVVEPHVRPVGTRGQLLEEEVIVCPILPLLDHPLEVFPEGPVVFGPLYIHLQWCLGGSDCGSLWMRSPSG